jgi:hypothetical protein
MTQWLHFRWYLTEVKEDQKESSGFRFYRMNLDVFTPHGCLGARGLGY